MIKIYNDCTKDSKLNCIRVSGLSSDIRTEVIGIVDALTVLLENLSEFDKRGKHEKR